MKKMNLFAICFIAFFLSACATRSTVIMSPLKYTGSNIAHLPQTAYVLWQPGQELAGEKTAPVVMAGMVGLVAGMIEAQDRKNNPSKFHYSYGKAQQATFITYFRDALIQNHVFNKINIITNKTKVKEQDVLIYINFKSTKVSGFERNHKITLTVEMSIQSQKPFFKRTYLTESDEGSFFKANEYDKQITDVSQQMLNHLMKGIQQWSQTT